MATSYFEGTWFSKQMKTKGPGCWNIQWDIRIMLVVDEQSMFILPRCRQIYNDMRLDYPHCNTGYRQQFKGDGKSQEGATGLLTTMRGEKKREWNPGGSVMEVGLQVSRRDLSSRKMFLLIVSEGTWFAGKCSIIFARGGGQK